jgi:16S rRNA (guanine527-N7)-methyltransferase
MRQCSTWNIDPSSPSSVCEALPIRAIRIKSAPRRDYAVAWPLAQCSTWNIHQIRESMSVATLSPTQIADLVSPYLAPSVFVPAPLYDQLSVYLDLLLKWNARTNLTAIREPQEIVRRHFGESLFAAQHLGDCSTLLDFGSGAGFPGLPIQLLRPELQVTLAESQNKKSTFLREVVRTLGLKTEVWANRVEAMPAGRTFDVVTLRAVDNMESAVSAASLRASRRLAILASGKQEAPALQGFTLAETALLPGEADLRLLLITRDSAL